MALRVDGVQVDVSGSAGGPGAVTLVRPAGALRERSAVDVAFLLPLPTGPGWCVAAVAEAVPAGHLAAGPWFATLALMADAGAFRAWRLGAGSRVTV